MNPAACQRAKKAARLAREAAEAPTPERLPATPELAAREAYLTYRKHTRPFRRAFRGIITRREAERFVIARVKRQTAVVQALTEDT